MTLKLDELIEAANEARQHGDKIEVVLVFVNKDMKVTQRSPSHVSLRMDVSTGENIFTLMMCETEEAHNNAIRDLRELVGRQKNKLN